MGEEYKISLGVDIDVDDIQSQIKSAESKVSPIKLNVEIENLNEIKQQLQNLGGTKGKAKVDIPINTQSIEQSLIRVANSIDDIKNSLGSLKSESGMKSLLSSINQISTALGKAESESESLIKTLSELSKKDFSFNIGLDTGKKGLSAVGYGRAARKQVIPELEAQIQYLERLHGGQQAAMTKLTKNKDIGFDIFTDFADFNSDSAIKKMEAMEKYINSLKRLATIDKVDLSGFNESFSRSASEMINDITGVENAVDKAEDIPQKLKNLFGGGISSEQLDSIVSDLSEIKKSINGLSEGINVDHITQSFKEMSAVLEDITNNLVIFRNAFGNVGSGLSNSIGSTTQGLKNNANILDTFKRSLQNIGMEEDKVDAIANRIKNLGVQIETLNQSQTKDNVLTVDISGIDQLGNAVKLTEKYNAETGELIQSIDKVSTVHQKAGKSADTFARQQQRAVTDLTNQINQLNRAATDQNAARPIKESSHLDSLESKYNEVISAIERMGAASNETFEVERNKVKTLISEYKSLKSEYKNAENVALQMDGNDFASGLEIAKNNLAKFKAEAQGFSQLTSTIKDLDTAIASVGDVSSLKEFNNQLRVAKSKLSEVKTETKGLDEIKFGLTDKGADGFKQAIASRQAAVDKLKQSTPELQDAMSRLNATMDAMDSANKANDIQRLKLAYQDYLTALKQVDSQLKMLQQDEDKAAKNASFEAAKEGALLRLKGLFSENSEAARRFGGDLDRIQRELNECGDTKGLAKINREITNLGREIKNADVKTQTFGQRFKKQWQQYTSYFSVASIFSYGMQGLRSMFEQVKLIDSAMTELKKVTDETDAAYNQFLTNAASRSKEIGTTIDGLVSSTADFARIGYGFEDAQGLAEVANIYAVVGDEIEGVEGATESLISTMAAFKNEMNGMDNTEFAMSIIDKFNEIGKLIA